MNDNSQEIINLKKLVDILEKEIINLKKQNKELLDNYNKLNEDKIFTIEYKSEIIKNLTFRELTLYKEIISLLEQNARLKLKTIL